MDGEILYYIASWNMNGYEEKILSLIVDYFEIESSVKGAQIRNKDLGSFFVKRAIFLNKKGK